jgi:hypothetical protein
MAPITISTKQLDFNKETKTFSAEISMLDNGGRLNIWHQAYSDACDEGIKVESHVTGKEVMYVVDRRDESEGEVHGWHLIPTKDSIRSVPECKGTKLFIMND